MLVRSDAPAAVTRRPVSDNDTAPTTTAVKSGDDNRAPRTIAEVDAANKATGSAVNGTGDIGGTYTGATRAPYGPEGSSAAQRGQAAFERFMADTAVPSQLQNDEFELIRHDNGKYTVVLPGVIDLSHPHWGLDSLSRSARDVDQFALPSSANASVDSNRYAQMVREYVLDNVPAGSDVMLVGHSYGADTAVDLAADPTFNNSETGVNVTHVVAAAYFNQPQLNSVPSDTQMLVLQNANDAAVIGEGLGYTATEVRNAAGRVVGGARDTAGDLWGMGGSLLNGDLGGLLGGGGRIVDRVVPDRIPTPDAGALLTTGVQRVDEHTLIARFDGGTEGIGHHQSNYIDYMNGAGQNSAEVRNFLASMSNAGYTAAGTTTAVDVSVPDTNYVTTYPGDGAVEKAHSIWDSIPGSDIVAGAFSTGADWASGAASTAWANRGLLGDARDALRDGAVSTWNNLPGNDSVESFVGGVADVLPFNNAAAAGLQALAGRGEITLDSDATAAIQRDPDFIATEAAIVQSIRGVDGYGQRPMDIPLSQLGVDLTVELGGQRGEGGMLDQLKNAWNLGDPNIRATWGVAGNELTWLLRHARLDGTAHVAADGSINIDYRISDTLDLRPGEGRSGAYNAITGIAGTLWHDVMGAKEAAVTGEFSRTVP